jgi:hypothetical protein
MKKMKSPEYVAKYGKICPYCGSDQVTFGPVQGSENPAGKIEEERVCVSCNKTWIETYVLSSWREGSFNE